MNERIESCKKVMGNTLQAPKENLPKEEEEEEEEESSGSSFTCEICIEPMAASKKFKNKNLCTHPFCQDCIAKYIQVKVQDDNTAKIECPGLECRHDLDPFSCEPIIPSSLFQNGVMFFAKIMFWGFERSYCPNTNCMALVVNECERNGTLKKAQCPSCKQWFCFQCKLKWHAGYRCEESGNLRDPNDIMFGLLVETMNWTRCPGCGHCVERKNGCSVVMCRCKTQFCYKCGGKYPLGCSCLRSFPCNCRRAFPILFIAGIIFFLALLMNLRTEDNRRTGRDQS